MMLELGGACMGMHEFEDGEVCTSSAVTDVSVCATVMVEVPDCQWQCEFDDGGREAEVSVSVWDSRRRCRCPCEMDGGGAGDRWSLIMECRGVFRFYAASLYVPIIHDL